MADSRNEPNLSSGSKVGPPKKTRAAKTTSGQKSYLVQYLVEHKQLVSRKFTSTFTAHDYERGWDDLVDKLNKLGPSVKDKANWKKYWLDVKGKSKLAASQLHLSQSRTGGGEGIPVEILTPTKQQIVSIIGGSSAVIGHTSVGVFGIKGKNSEAFPKFATISSDEDEMARSPNLLALQEHDRREPSRSMSPIPNFPSTSSTSAKRAMDTPAVLKVKQKAPVAMSLFDTICPPSPDTPAVLKVEQKAQVAKNLFDTICPPLKQLKSDTERGQHSAKRRRQSSSIDQDRLMQAQEEQNSLLRKRLELQQEKNGLLRERNEIEARKVDALNSIALNLMSSFITTDP